MSLEERIVRELRAERAMVPEVAQGPIPSNLPKWPHRLAQVTAILVVMGVIVGTGWAIGREGGGQVAADAVEDGELLVDADVALPIASEWGRMKARSGAFTVLVGAEGPPPAFDVADLEGAEQPLLMGTPVWNPNLWAGDVPVVYVGDIDDRSVFVHTNGTISPIDRLTAAFEGSTIGPHICLTVGSYDAATGGVGLCGGGTTSGGPFIKNGPGELNAGWASWIDVPTGTSVVTATLEGTVVLWQRPIGETVFFDLGKIPEGPVTLTAISAAGDELATETIPRELYQRG